jgi:hypothetical protein
VLIRLELFREESDFSRHMGREFGLFGEIFDGFWQLRREESAMGGEQKSARRLDMR